MHVRLVRAVLTVAITCSLSACASKEQTELTLGYAGASGSEMQPGDPAPLDESDLEAMADRGIELFWLEHQTILAFDVGLRRAGRHNSVTLLPVASVDDGAHSGQVTFYRWLKTDVPDDGTLEPTAAKKWLVVPMLLQPDRVLENEQFSEEIDPDGEDFLRVRAILAAARHAADTVPGGQWHMHAFRERIGRGQATRIYLFSASAGSPDLELVMADPKKKKDPPSLLGDVVIHHHAGAWEGDVIETAVPSPTPMTVARVRSRGLDAGDVQVTSSDGTKWWVNAETGAIRRAGPSQE